MGEKQLENMLNTLEASKPYNVKKARKEILESLRINEERIVQQLAERGEASVPTKSWGTFRITAEDLEVAAV